MKNEMFNQVRLVDGVVRRVWIEDRGMVALIDVDGLMVFRPKAEVAKAEYLLDDDLRVVDAFPADPRNLQMEAVKAHAKMMQDAADAFNAAYPPAKVVGGIPVYHF